MRLTSSPLVLALLLPLPSLAQQATRIRMRRRQRGATARACPAGRHRLEGGRTADHRSRPAPGGARRTRARWRGGRQIQARATTGSGPSRHFPKCERRSESAQVRGRMRSPCSSPRLAAARRHGRSRRGCLRFTGGAAERRAGSLAGKIAYVDYRMQRAPMAVGMGPPVRSAARSVGRDQGRRDRVPDALGGNRLAPQPAYRQYPLR